LGPIRVQEQPENQRTRGKTTQNRSKRDNLAMSRIRSEYLDRDSSDRSVGSNVRVREEPDEEDEEENDEEKEDEEEDDGYSE
jgi:hypothetical protein